MKKTPLGQGDLLVVSKAQAEFTSLKQPLGTAKIIGVNQTQHQNLNQIKRQVSQSKSCSKSSLNPGEEGALQRVLRGRWASPSSTTQEVSIRHHPMP